MSANQGLSKNFFLSLVMFSGIMLSISLFAPSNSLAQTTDGDNTQVLSDAGHDVLIDVGDEVRLDGGGSINSSGDDLTFNWQVVSAPVAVSLSDSGAVRPRFTATASGDYVFSLTVSDGSISSSDQVTVSTSNVSPVANAGFDRAVLVGNTVRLNGSASFDGDGNALSYQWSLVERPIGSTAGLSSSSGLYPEFTVDLEGDYIVELLVVDSFGNQSDISQILLTTNNVAPVANAGRDVAIGLSQSVSFDPEGTFDANGDFLETSWSIIARPDGSAATLNEDEDGRFVLTADVAGDYIVQLTASDASDEGFDTIVVSVGEDRNVAPVARIVSNSEISLGQSVTLDGSLSTDVNGDFLSYRWALVGRPVGSVATIENDIGVRPTFFADVAGDYVAQLIVSDGALLSVPTTRVISTNNQPPISNAGPDSQLVNDNASLSGNESFDPDNDSLSPLWAVVAGANGAETGEFDPSNELDTVISFSSGSDVDGLLTGQQATDALALLSEYNLVSFSNLISSVSINGRALVGGNLVGQSATFASGVNPASGINVLEVVGNINGGPKNINNGGNVRVGGQVNTNINLNGGGQIINDPSLNIDNERVLLTGLSVDLAGLSENSSAQLPPRTGPGQPGPARLNASPDENGVAVFSIEDGRDLFSNNRVQQIEINANGAETIIVNVGGNSVRFNRGNIVGFAGSQEASRRIIWNFHEASSLRLDRRLNGAILAPNATLINRTNINGAVVANLIQARGPFGLPLFEGDGLVGEGDGGDPVSLALVQLGVTDGSGFDTVFDTAILTTGNIRPVANAGDGLTVSLGDEVSLTAGASTDGNNDPLDYSWSLLARPENSSAIINDPSAINPSFIADQRGIYVAQLIVSDTNLASAPVTVVIEVGNSLPIANAGVDQSVFVGDVAQLDGSGSSDADNDPLTYSWSLVSAPQGSTASLLNATDISPTFSPDIRGDYNIQLIVNDGFSDSEPDIVTITSPNRIPIADAGGDQAGTTNGLIALNGGGSIDPDGDNLQFLWSLTLPAGSNAVLSDATIATPTFTADEPGVYLAQLVVNDGIESSAPAVATITIVPVNQPPVLAALNDQTVTFGSQLSLALGATDADNDDLSFFVSSLPLPQGLTFDSSTGSITYRPSSLEPSSVTISVGVSDGASTDTQTFTISVVDDPQGGNTGFTGRVVDATDPAVPVEGAMVMINQQTVITNADGEFFLTELPAGDQLVMILPDGAQASDGTPYVNTQFTVNLSENVNNTSFDDFLLPRLNGPTAEILPGQSTILSGEAIGISLQIPADTIVTEAVTQPHRFWRIVSNANFSPSQPGRGSVGELAFFDENGVRIELTGNETPIAGSESTAALFRLEQAFDGNGGTRWLSNGSGIREETWIGLDFGVGAEISVSGVFIQAGTITGGFEAPSDFDLEYSDDGDTWFTLAQFPDTGPRFDVLEIRTFDVDEILVTDSIDPDFISIASITADQANQLPVGIAPCNLFTIDPKAYTLTQAVNFSVTNFDNLPAGAQVDLWVLRGINFFVTGTGVVSSDGQFIDISDIVLTPGDIFAFAPRMGDINLAADQPTTTYVPSLLGEGNYQTSLAIPGFKSIEQSRAISLIYNSTAAVPAPIVASEFTANDNGVPVSVVSSVELAGANVAQDEAVSTQSGIGGLGALASGQSLRQASQFDAKGLETGVYPYRFLSVGNYACSSVTQEVSGQVFIDNQIDSPFGRGWTLSELSRLTPQPDGGVIIREGNGVVSEFAAQTDLSTIADAIPVRLPISGPSQGQVGDVDGDGDLDIVWHASEAGGLNIYENNGDGTFGDFQFIEIGEIVDAPPTGNFSPDVTDLTFGDFDNDGFTDLLIGTQNTDRVFAAYQNPTLQRFDEASPVEDVIVDITSIQSGDFNGDGIDDAIAGEGGFFVGAGSVVFGRTDRDLIIEEFDPAIFFAPLSLIIQDINGDGLDDVLQRGSREIGLSIGQADGPLRNIALFNQDSADLLGDFARLSDADLDGLIDIIISDVEADEIIVVRQNGQLVTQPDEDGNLPNPITNANLGFEDFLILPVPGEAGTFDMADINGDTLLDIVMGSGTNIITWFALETGGYSEPEIVETGFQTGSIELADMNNDGSFDVVVDEQLTDEVLVYFSDPTRSSRFVDPFADFTELVRNEDGSFSRRFTDGTVIEYDADGLQTAVTDRNNNRSEYAYDDQERLVSITDPAGLVTTFEYNSPGGRLSRTTYPDGRFASWEYNQFGDLIQMTDVNGDTTVNAYDPAGRLTADTDPRGFTTQHQYDNAGRYSGSTLADNTQIDLDVAKSLGLASLDGGTGEYVPADMRETRVVDGRGNVTLTVVNEFGAPIQVTDPIGRVSTFIRDVNNLVVEAQTPLEFAAGGSAALLQGAGTVINRIDTMAYDFDGNLTRHTEAAGTEIVRTIRVSYDGEFSKVIFHQDADGFVTLYNYDDRGNRLNQTDPEGGITTYTYDSRGLPLSMIDENGNLTQMFYDANGLEIQRIDASNTVMVYERDGAGNIIRMVEDDGGPLEREMLSTYDEKNRLISYTAADGGVTQYVYDGNDYVIQLTDPTGVIETREFDERSRLVAVNDPIGGRMEYEYDPDSNEILFIDALNQTTIMDWDSVNRLIRSVDALDQERFFAYDLRDNIARVTDARGNATTYDFDALDRPVSRTNPLEETWVFSYDLRDNRVALTKPDGVVITAAYDGLSRLTNLVGGASNGGLGGASIGAVTRTYAYDPYDNLVAANDNREGVNTAQTSFTYDQENRLTGQTVANLFGTGAVNTVLAYDYDELDRRRTLNDSFTGQIGYLYDPVDRLTSLTTPQGDLFEKTYDVAGRGLAKTAPNVTDKDYDYELPGDPVPNAALNTGRLAAKAHRAGGATFNEYDYAYTERGNLSDIAEGATVTRARTYSYDDLERLTEVVSPDAPANDESYTYDEEGNRLTSHLSSLHITNEANRLTEDDQFTYVYDANGNLIAKNPKILALSTWNYAYDAFDELIAVFRDGTLVERYEYDALGRRSRIITAATNDNTAADIGIVNDGPDRYLDLSGPATIAKRFIHGAGVDEPYEMQAFDSAGLLTGRFTYHTDHLGSVRFMTDQAGNIANEYDYDSYGRVTGEVETVEQPFGFTGRDYDEAVNLYQYRARAYDPETGRFNQEDPIWFEAGDLNIYRYVHNNPLNYTDPSGLAATAEKAALGAVIVGAAGLTLSTAARRDTEGATLAAEIATKNLSSVARVGAGIACKLLTIAHGISIGGIPNTLCSTTADKREEKKDPPITIYHPEPTRGGKCSCNCRVTAGRDVLNPPKPRFAKMTLPDDPGCRQTAIATCRVAKKRLAVNSTHHQNAICRFNNQKPFPVFKDKK